MTNVILVDDHELFRVGIKGALMREKDICIIGEAGSGKELFELLQTTTPDPIHII